jgi:hypothetical protein
MANLTLPTLKDLGPDATDAAWRVAGGQLVKLAREPLVAALSRQLGPGDQALQAKLAAFLQTELGTAVLASLLSLGLSALPQMPGLGPAPERLARELRVRAMADAGDVAADVVLGPLRQVLVGLLSAPADTTTDASLTAGDTTTSPRLAWEALPTQVAA